MEMIKLIISLICWGFSIIPKFFKGLVYIFLKRPTLIKYAGLGISMLVAFYIMLLNAEKWGIIALFGGLLFPVAYIATFGNKLDNFKHEEAKNNHIFTQEEIEIFESQMANDEKFKKNIESKFTKHREQKNIKEEKQLEKNMMKDLEKETTKRKKIEGSVKKNTFKTVDYSTLDQLIKHTIEEDEDE